ncbi:MAG: peptidylprolyl isomerase [Chloroflexi bacterium]|nr:peptidylprolyl isomerase [Chloroflexota bacterium]
MATYRPPGTSRREREERDRRRERLVIYGVVGVLVVAILVVLAGLYFTQYLPPRAHILSVGGNDYDASAVARRALYEMRYGDEGLSGFDTAVSETIEIIENTEVVLARAPAVVGDVSDEDVRADLYERLTLEDDATDGEFVDALAERLTDSRLSRAELEEIVTASILVGRLRDAFVDEYGEVTPQVLLSRIRLADEAAAEEIREQVVGGADFAALADERSSDAASSGAGGDIGWFPLAALPPEARAALEGLEPDAVSAIVRDGPFYDVYLVRERDEARAIDEAQRESLGATRFLEWLDAERETVEVSVDLSAGEERWILDRLISDLGS